MAIDKNRQTLQHVRTSEEGKKVQVGFLKEGEIAVRYSHNNPALMIEDADKHIVEFISSGAVVTAISAISVSSSAKLSELSGATIALAKQHKDDVEYLEGAINSAASETLASAKTYTNDELIKVSGATNSLVNNIEKEIYSVSGDLKSDIVSEAAARSDADTALGIGLSAFSGSVVEEIANLMTTATQNLDNAKAYTNAELRKVSGATNSLVNNIEKEIYSVSGDLKSDIVSEAAARSAADTALGIGLSAFSANVITYINDELSIVYKVKGSVADVAALAAVQKPEVGDVYNVVASGKTPATGFRETEKEFEGGSNFVYTENGWDILGGVLDFTALNELSASVKTLSAGTIGAIASEAAVRSAADTALGIGLSAFSGSVVEEIANLMTTATQNLDNAKAYTNAELRKVSGATNSLVNNIEKEIYSVSGDLKSDIVSEAAARSAADTALGTALSAVSAVSVTAVQDVVLDKLTSYDTADTMNNAAGTATGAYVAKEGTTVKLDLTYLSIDCGTF